MVSTIPFAPMSTHFRRCAERLLASTFSSERDRQMMNSSRLMRATTASAVALALAACKMDVVNPGVIDASQFDPSGDAATLSLSAQSNFYKAYTGSVYWSAFFSGELVVGAVRQETNDIGRRVATSSTNDVGNAWGNLQRSLATNELAAQSL